MTRSSYHDSHIYIIDVSQSVEHDHPKTFEFLRTDIRNVEDFFKRRSGGDVKTLGPRRTWEFVVSESVGLSSEAELGEGGERRLSAIVTGRVQEERDETDDAVFMSSFIPRTLGEVYDPERDVDLYNAGRGNELIYSTLTGLDLAKAAAFEPSHIAAERSKGRGVHSSGSEDNQADLSEAEDTQDRPRGFRNEDKDAKKVRSRSR